MRNSATGDQKNISGSADIAAKYGEHYKVTCFVEDPEGVHQIKLGGGKRYSCKMSGNLTYAADIDLFPVSQVLNPDSNGNVLPQIFLITDVNLEIRCPEDTSFLGARVTLDCWGENYNGGNAEGGLVFSVSR